MPTRLSGLDVASGATADGVGSILTGRFPSLAVGQTAHVEAVSVITTGTQTPFLLYLSLWAPALSGGTFRKVGPMDDGVNSDDLSPPMIVPPSTPLFWTLQSPLAGAAVTVRLFGYVECDYVVA